MNKCYLLMLSALKLSVCFLFLYSYLTTDNTKSYFLKLPHGTDNVFHVWFRYIFFTQLSFIPLILDKLKEVKVSRCESISYFPNLVELIFISDI